MKTLIEKSRHLALIAVLALLGTFGFALLWGVVKAIAVWSEIIKSYGQSAAISLLLIKVVDAFLIAIVLYILAASIYKLFIGELSLPSKLVARNLPELKSKLSSIIVLVVAVRFVETLFELSLPPIEIMWLSVATTLIAAALIAFGFFSYKGDMTDNQQ